MRPTSRPIDSVPRSRVSLEAGARGLVGGLRPVGGHLPASGGPRPARLLLRRVADRAEPRLLDGARRVGPAHDPDPSGTRHQQRPRDVSQPRAVGQTGGNGRHHVGWPPGLPDGCRRVGDLRPSMVGTVRRCLRELHRAVAGGPLGAVAVAAAVGGRAGRIRARQSGHLGAGHAYDSGDGVGHRTEREGARLRACRCLGDVVLHHR